MKGVKILGGCSKELNRLAREQLKLRLLADILTDMEISRLEGWPPLEYVNELILLLQSILNKENEKA